ERVAGEITYHRPIIDFISNLSGQFEAERVATSEYWVRHARQAVNFVAGVRTLHELKPQCFVEVGPKPTLLNLVRQCLPDEDQGWLPSLRFGVDDGRQMLHSLGELYRRGAKVDWVGFHQHNRSHRRKVDLPTYPWQRRRFWFETAISRRPDQTRRTPDRAVHPLLGRQLYSAAFRNGEILFEAALSEDWPPYLNQHRLLDQPILPFGAYLEMALAAAMRLAASQQSMPPAGIVIEDFTIEQPLLLEETSKIIQFLLTPNPTNASFEIFSLTPIANTEPSWTFHASGSVSVQQVTMIESQLPVDIEHISTWLAENLRRVNLERYRQYFHTPDLADREPGQLLLQLWQGENQAVGQIQLPEQFFSDADDYRLHPLLWDTALQVLGAAFLPADPNDWVTSTRFYIPVGCQRVIWFGQHPPAADDKLWCQAQISASSQDMLHGDVHFLTPDGSPVAAIEGLQLKSVSRRYFAARQIVKQDWFYEVEWQPKPFDGVEETTTFADRLAPQAALVAQANKQVANERWLILADNSGLGQDLAALLQASGSTPLLVSLGKDFTQVDTHTFKISNSKADFERLFATFPDIDRVVHLWSLDAPPVEALTPELLETTNNPAWISTLHLSQVMANLAAPPSLWLITRGANAVSGSDLTGLAQAPLWGLGKTIALEHPKIWGGLLDLAPLAEAHEAVRLLAEMSRPNREDQLAFRAGNRFAARLVRRNISGQSTDLVQVDGTYLVTGGLGDLGLLTARWLVEAGAKHLVLIGRRGAATPAARTEIDRLAQAGASVRVVKTDVSNPDDMSRLFDEISTNRPPLRGIIHAAGVMEAAAVLEIGPDDLDAVLRPKVAGAWLLHQLSRHLELDFFIMFASISGVWGSAQLAHYAAANHFLDMLAHYRAGLGLPAVSIDWGPWAVGRLAAQTNLLPLLSRIGLNPFDADEAIEVLRYLDQVGPQIVVADVDWPRFKDIYEARKARPQFDTIQVKTQAEPQPINSAIVQQLKAAEQQARHALLMAHIQAQIAHALGFTLDELNVEQPLNYMGIDSLMAFELRNRIKRELGVEISLESFLEDPTVASLTTQILDRLSTSPFSVLNQSLPEEQSLDDPSEIKWVEGEL
ncbi:MAG TPA: SDR family NAD(P)-dependent oxidoreductase, partial [Anaerolineae bacterium]